MTANNAILRRGAMVTALLLAATASLSAQDAQELTTRRLTLKEAIELALKNNLGVRLAASQEDQAAGTRERRLAALLPHVSGDALANLQRRNLRAVGISVPGLPLVVGPFSTYDFRVFADQTLIDRRAYHALKASEVQQQAAKLTYQDARDLVIRQAGGLYLNAQAIAAEVEAAESRVVTSRALERLAQDQHKAGLATGIDVVRAQVQLKRDQQALLVARNGYQSALLVLARFLGLSPGLPLELADRLKFRRVESPDTAQAIQMAFAARPDYQAMLAQRESLVEQQKASRARYLPKLSINGDYGVLGRNFGEIPGTGQIQGILSITLFDRDRRGEAKELESQARGLDAQLADIRRGIEQELRQALLDLQSAEEQVGVTEAAVDLAGKEITLAEDRFRNGVTDNIEVVNAQDALSRAQDDHIQALARHADARMALARALGATEKIYLLYLDGN